jgi:hypothetical protein
MAISINSSCKLLLYADDSAILFSHRDPDLISRTLGSVLESCNGWLVDNKLSLHLGKTECILFGSKPKLSKVDTFKIECNGQVIDAANSVKYLGIDLDQWMSGESIAQKVIKKTTGRIKFLYRQGSCLNFSCRKLLCSALIQCHFDYASCAWYAGISSKTKKNLQISQNKMARFILNLSPRSHIGQEELGSIGFLNIEDRVKYLRLNHVYKIANVCNAPYLTEYFTKFSQFHRYHTRGSQHNFIIPLVKGIAASTFFFNGIREWNSLPDNIKGSLNNSIFKRALKNKMGL